MPSFLMGCLFMLSYLLLLAGLDVYVGHLTQNIDPIRLAFWCFLCALSFFVFTLKKSQKVKLMEGVRRHGRSFVMINLATTLAWLTYFISLKFIEPMLVAVISCSITPILTVYISKIFRPHMRSTKTEVFASTALICGIAVALWQTLDGKSAVGFVTNSASWWGFIAAVLCGVGMTLCTLYSKTLYESGYSSGEIMATRFWILLIMSGVLSLIRGGILPESMVEIYSILIISIGANIVGLYLLQKGIERLEPTTVSFFFAGGPIAVLPFQFLDPRLNFSTSSLVLSVLTVIWMSLGIASRSRLKEAKA